MNNKPEIPRIVASGDVPPRNTPTPNPVMEDGEDGSGEGWGYGPTMHWVYWERRWRARAGGFKNL